MGLNFYESSLPIRTSPQTEYKEALQAVIDSDFSNSSSYYTIEEELVFGTQEFTETDARVVHIINSTTGEKLGDDYKEIIFQDMTHTKGVGYRYKFDNNVWITINTDNYKYITASSVVRRCNNVLKWYDQYGVLKVEPCAIGYRLSDDDVDVNPGVAIAEGLIRVTVQTNSITKNIKINDRFLFGGQAFKIRSINNMLNLQTYDSNSVPITTFVLYKDGIQPGDDVVNNIPTSQTNNFSITINQENFEQVVGYSGTLTTIVKLNDEIVSEPVIWESSDDLLATINNSGVFNLVSNGNVTFTAKMLNNSNITSSIQITINALPSGVPYVVINPYVYEVNQGKTQIYTIYKYVNGVQQPDLFTFTSSGVPNDNYKLNIIDGNTFSITNIKMYLNNNLTIDCVSGSDSESINIRLKGVW